MAKFLITVWPLPGHYYPNVAVAAALRSRGHEVAFFTGSRARAAIESEGFRCFTFEQVDEGRLEQAVFAAQPSPPRWKPHLLVQSDRYYNWVVGVLPGQVPDVKKIIEQWSPDLLICDPMMWGPILVIRELHAIPVAVFDFVPFCPLPGPGIPPLGLGLPVPRGPLARLWTWFFARMIWLGSARFRRAANALRREYGLAPISSSVTEFTGQMPLYLVAGTSDFDYGRSDLPPSVHYIGPSDWERPRKEPPVPWLGELSHNQPWVYVSEGTIHTQIPFVSRAAAQGLANLPMQVIITTATQEPDERLGSLASNIHAEHWTRIHYQDVLPNASLVVSTGGGGTVMAALKAGVPLVVVPTEWDKPEVAQRLVEAGAGIRIAPRHCTPKRLRAAVEQVLGDSSYRDNARRLAESLKGYRGAQEAAELLEKLSVSKCAAGTPQVK